MVGFLLYWLRWIRSLYVFYILYNKSRKPAKVFLLSHPIFIVSYSVVISILLLFLLPSKELPVRIEINKQKSSSRLFSQFSPTPVRSVVLRMFSKRFYGCVILPGSLPSPCAGLQLVTKPSHRKEEYNRSGSNLYFSEILPTRRLTTAWQYQKYLALPSWLKVYVSICKVYWKFCYKLKCYKSFCNLTRK